MSSLDSESASKSTNNTVEGKRVDHSGWLKKKGAFFGIWHPFFCELQDGKDLVLYKNDVIKTPEATIRITNDTQVRSITNDKTPRLIIENDREPSFVFSHEDPDAILAWVLALRTATFESSNMSMDCFDIVSVIGRGYYGKVMLVKDKQTKQLYAVKSIHKSRLLKSNKVHTVIRERNILVKIANPFIVKLEFAFQNETKFYLGLEYVPGGELFRLMTSDDFVPFEDAKLYIAEIAIALQYLHENGIIYRDLKPENILLSAEGHIKLTDFGLSKELQEDTTSTFCGTPEYIAPEIIKREKYSFPIDWWSLGVLSYELIFAETPFPSTNRVKLFQQVVSAEPNFPPNADPKAVNFLKKLLTKDPKRRAKFVDIENHPFWDGLNLDDVRKLKVHPKYRPRTDDDQALENFSSEFTQEPANDSIATPTFGVPPNFTGFSFDGSESLSPLVEEDAVPSSILAFPPEIDPIL